MRLPERARLCIFPLELLQVKSGIKLTHVPYKGGAQAVQDVIGGGCPSTWTSTTPSPSTSKRASRDCRLTSEKRPAYARDIPLVSETVPGVTAVSLVGLVVPSATPRDIVRKASADIARAVKSSDLTGRMVAQGMEPVGSTPEEFDAVIRAEIAKWAPVVKASGAKAD
jgi:tripartite-type tricarboxylate transporter receptor subunit TctC